MGFHRRTFYLGFAVMEDDFSSLKERNQEIVSLLTPVLLPQSLSLPATLFLTEGVPLAAGRFSISPVTIPHIRNLRLLLYEPIPF